MWLMIAPIILAGSVAAYLFAPQYSTVNFNEKKIGFPEQLQSVVNENYMFNLRKNYSGETLLQVIQLSAINPASELVSIIFMKEENEKKKALIGFMGDQKVYDFNLGNIQLPFEIIVTDTIEKKELALINF